METLRMLAVIASNYTSKNSAFGKACLEALDEAFWAVRAKYGEQITDDDTVHALYNIIDIQLNAENH